MTKNTAVDIIHTVDFLSNRAKAVFIALASFSNKDDTCFPSVATIAKRCGLSESTVHRAIADLIVMELIIKTANYRENMGCTSNTYTLINPLEAANMAPAPCQTDRGEGVNLIPTIEYDNSFNMNNLTCSIQTDIEDDFEITKREKNEITVNEILESCELPFIRVNYGEDFSSMLKNTVYRLYYSERLRIGNVVLPQEVIRESLRYLNYHTLETAIEKLKDNPKRKVKNSSAYLTVLLFNAITEQDIDWYIMKTAAGRKEY